MGRYSANSPARPSLAGSLDWLLSSFCLLVCSVRWGGGALFLDSLFVGLSPDDTEESRVGESEEEP
jgi:hypothetical protein